MARLTVDEREYILYQLLKPVHKELGESKLEVGAAVDNYCRKQTPQEVLEFSQKYPESIRKLTSIYIYNIEPSSKDYENISIEAYFEGIHSFEEIRKDIGYQEAYKRRAELLRKEKELKGKIKCVLSGITTEKRLKEEFPEAFEVLLARYNTKEEDASRSTSSNLCDSIENVRAQLFGKTKSKQ